MLFEANSTEFPRLPCWRYERGVRFQHTPRLRRIKYDPEARPTRPQVTSPLLGEETTIWGSVSTRFRDIDGNTFSLVSFDEVTHALEAQRRAQAEKLESERRAAGRSGDRRGVGRPP